MAQHGLGPKEWSQEDIDHLHEMVADYQHAKWFRKQLKWWGLWLLGLPTTILLVWESVVKLLKFARGI